MRRGLGGAYRRRFIFPEHHESHAASAFFPSPFAEAAVITLDGVGEWTTAAWGVGRGNCLSLKQEIRFPHSLGLLYSAFTYYTGFRVNSGEYKLMGLAPYGTPRFADLILEHLIDVKEDGSFWLDQSYFDYCAGLTMTSRKFHELFGGPPRKPESKLTQRDMDLAASVQEVTERVMLKIATHVHRQTGLSRLCLAGGVALNCVGNGRILREGPFSDLWIQPASGDAGGALGAALYCAHQLLGVERVRAPDADARGRDAMQGSCLGPSYDSKEVQQQLDGLSAAYEVIEDLNELCDRVAQILSDGGVVGNFTGRAEFGPRALGNRSILGDARNPRMQAQMNVKIKFRESFRPFAPSCLEELTPEYFELDAPSPYMLLVAPVRSQRRKRMTEEQQGFFGIDKLNVLRSDLPAITHVDYSARVQTVNAERAPLYHRLLEAFRRRTGCGVLVNTSFNIRGEPIVGSPAEAYRCFMYTDMDALVVENCLCLKAAQPAMPGAEAYKAQFKLD
jgi:carbamoyltransferase